MNQFNFYYPLSIAYYTVVFCIMRRTGEPKQHVVADSVLLANIQSVAIFLSYFISFYFLLLLLDFIHFMHFLISVNVCVPLQAFFFAYYNASFMISKSVAQNQMNNKTKLKRSPSSVFSAKKELKKHVFMLFIFHLVLHSNNFNRQVN